MNHAMRLRSILVGGSMALLIAIGAARAIGGDWPQFRGPSGQGKAVGESPPLTWSESKNVAWRTPLPGRGWSSPVVVGNQVWMTTAITTEADPEQADRRAKEHTASHLPLNVPESVSLRALCVDRHSGQHVHDLELFNVAWPEPIHTLNTHASPTPVAEPGRVYCNFGTWGTACLDTQTLEVLWTADYPIEHFVGPGSSPFLYRDRLILTCDGADRQFVVALDKQSGKELWRRDRPPIEATNPDQRKSYCTPLTIRVDGQEQVVIPSTQWIVSYDPGTGEEIWRAEHGNGFSLVPRPVSSDGMVFFSTGFGRPQELIAVRTDGRGDVTQSHIAWRTSSQTPTLASPLVQGDLLFTVSDSGVAVCRDTRSGKRVWQDRVGGNYSASPVLADGRIYFWNREGVTTVIVAGDEYEELARNELDEAIMATPAVVDGVIFLRTEQALYCIADQSAPTVAGR